MQGWEKTASRRRRYTSQGLIKRTTRVHSSRDSTGRDECNINIFRAGEEDAATTTTGPAFPPTKA